MFFMGFDTLLVKQLFVIQIYRSEFINLIYYKAKGVTSTHMLLFPLSLFACVLMETNRSLL